MSYEPKPSDIRPIKPSKPVLDLSTGTLYMNGNSMKDLEMHAMDSIKSIEFEPEPVDIMNIMSKNVFWNVKPMSMNTIIKIEPSFINDNIIQDKPVGPWEMRKHDQIQKRKHHKTRINKKWAKRYGYTTIEHVYEVLDLKADPSSLDSEQVIYDATLELKEARMY